MPAVLGPLGFLNPEPQHGWSNGVPALRQRSSLPCRSFSLAGASSPRPSLDSSTITLPRLEARYLNGICLRVSSFTSPSPPITSPSPPTPPNPPPCPPPFIH